MNSDKRSENPGEDLTLALMGMVAAILLLLSPWLVDQSGPDPYYKGPLIYPQIVLGMMALASVAPALRFLRRKTALIWRGMPARSSGVFLLMCLYPVAISAVGLPAAVLFAAGSGLLMAGTGWRMAGTVAVAASAILWLLFVGLLDIWLPQPWLAQLFTG